MKKVFLLLAIISVIFNSCSKESGAIGPAGSQGPVGPAGANGTVIYSGMTAPTTSIGYAGDFYLDLSSHILYGPKSSEGWGTGFSMAGPTGASGANQVQEMPVSLTYNNMTDTWSSIITPGNVEIDFVNSQNFYTQGFSDAHEFRCVIVPGGVNIPAGLHGSELMRYLRVPAN